MKSVHLKIIDIKGFMSVTDYSNKTGAEILLQGNRVVLCKYMVLGTKNMIPIDGPNFSRDWFLSKSLV